MKQGVKGLYTYRRRVPTDLKQAWGIREVKVALKTADHALALKAGAEANLQFEIKAKHLRLTARDAAQKNAIEKLEERKWIIQTATNMLKQEGVLPSQQPKLADGATLKTLADWMTGVGTYQDNLISILQDKYLDEEKQQRDYDAGKWPTENSYRPVDPNDMDKVALEILSGSTPPQTIEATWKDTVDIYIKENKAEAQRTEHNQRKHELRMRKIADELASYLGSGQKEAGYDTKLSEFTRMWILGFKQYCSHTHPDWRPATFNKGISLLSAAFNKGVTIFELTLNNPFEGLKVRETAAHVSGVPSANISRRSFTPEELTHYEGLLKTKRPDVKTIGLLMIWTGCRTMEIAGLTFNELLLDVNVPHLDIKPNHIRRLKTLSSERKVPLITDALDAMRDYLQSQQNTKPSDPVFPRFGRDGGMDPLSQNLRSIIRNQMQITDRRLVPYSTRHTLKDKMRVIRTPLALQLELMGHQNPNRIADEYGDGDPLIYLRQELERATKVEVWGQGV